MDRESQRAFQRIDNWQREHTKLHETEAKILSQYRRWIVSGVIIPTAAVLVTGIGIILTIVTLH
jgi:hypothetical protein